MTSVNSQYNASSGADDVPIKNVAYTGSKGKIPTLVDYNAFASSGTTLAIANKPPILGDRTITLPNIPVDVDWNLTSNQGATLCVKNKPNIPSVPTLATVATTGSYNDLTGKPSFSTVASTGAYSDLSGKPTIPSLPSGVVAASSGAQTQQVPLLNGQFFTGTWGTPTYATITDWNRADVISYAVFYQAFYNNQTGRPVTLPAGYFNLNVPTQQAFRMCGWDFVDGSRYLADVTDFNKSVTVSGNKLGAVEGVSTNVSHGLGSGGNNDQTNPLCRPYPGFVQDAYTTPLYPNANLYFSIVGGSTLSATSASVTLPAGISEFRFVAWPSMTSAVPSPYFTIDNFFVMSPFYSILDNSIPAVKSLIVQQPRTWMYYFNGSAVNGPQTTYSPVSSAWTLVSPTGTAGIMSASDGKLVIPQTGIYSITLSSSWGGGGLATANHRMTSDDPALGILANQMMFGEILDIQRVDQIDTSMTTRLTGGSKLSPVFNFSGILFGSNTNANALTRIVITLIYACA